MDETENKTLSKEEILNYINNVNAEVNQNVSKPNPESEVKLTPDDVKELNKLGINFDTGSKQKDSNAKDTIDGEQIEEQKRKVVPLDSTIINPTTTNFLGDMDLSKVKITEEEKESYLRCVLNDAPFICDIHLGKTLSSSITFRTRFVKEQELLHKLTTDNIKNKVFEFDSDLVLFMYKTNLILMLDTDFKYNNISDYEQFKCEIYKDLDKINSYNQIKFNAIAKAACIFEQKVKLLSEFIINEDFS